MNADGEGVVDPPISSKRMVIFWFKGGKNWRSFYSVNSAEKASVVPGFCRKARR